MPPAPQELWEKDRERIAKRIPRGWGQYLGVGDGWMPIVIELDKALAEIDPDYNLVQCKEKFGGLRYYFDATTREAYEKMNPLVSEAEAKSYKTCENCGGPGAPRGARPGEKYNWIKTLCDTCADGRPVLDWDM